MLPATNTPALSTRKPTGERLRCWTLAVFAFGAAGTAAELGLLGHYEDFWQRVPLAVLGLGLASSGSLALRPSPRTVKAFRVLMGLFVLSGAAGLYHHLTGNMEFEKELKPALANWPLIWESLRGATPALAPGAFLQLGLVGLIATWDHPAGRSQSK